MSTDTTNEKGTPQSRTYTVNDIAAILGIGRASAYKLANSGLFKTIRIGNMIRISRKKIRQVVQKYNFNQLLSNAFCPILIINQKILGAMVINMDLESRNGN